LLWRRKFNPPPSPTPSGQPGQSLPPQVPQTKKLKNNIETEIIKIKLIKRAKKLLLLRRILPEK